jgi:HAD superfamily phosphoserine phosphatase-like hydrolase
MKNTFTQGNWNDEIYSYLTELIPNSVGTTAFDFDNTLIKNDFGETVMNSLIEEGLPFLKEEFSDFFSDKKLASSIFSNRFQNPHAFKDLILNEYSDLLQNQSTEIAYRWSSFIFSGLTEIEQREFTRKVWTREMDSTASSSVKIFQDMVNLIDYMKLHGWKIFIITASPEVIIREVANHFHIEPKNVIGMNLKIENGIFTSKIIEPYTYGIGKVNALQSRFGLTVDLAFGDSENDFPLLSSAKKKGIALDKGDVEYIKKCRTKNFYIQKHFF